MMNRINLIAILAIAIVVSIPIAYSAVEPSIIINLVGSQTTDPFQIKDSGGTTLYRIDEVGCENSICNIDVEVVEEITHDTSTQSGAGRENFTLIFAEYEIEFAVCCQPDVPTSSFNSEVMLQNNGRMEAFLISEAGSDSPSETIMRVGIYVSDDGGVTFTHQPMFISTNSLVYTQRDDTNTSPNEVCRSRASHNLVGLPDCIISVRAGGSNNNNGTLSLKGFHLNIDVFLPAGATIVRTI